MTKSRLTPQDWLYAGFRALTQDGPQALRAEAIARDLKTTKGSFYWHFKDVPDFKQKMLLFWEEQTTEKVKAAVASNDHPIAQLRELAEVATEDDPVYGGRGAEPAIRAWAREDPNVAQAVSRVDRDRLAFLSGVLEKMGSVDPVITRIFYATHVGLEMIDADTELPDAMTLATLISKLLSAPAVDEVASTSISA